MIKWEKNGTNELIWKHPEKKVFWNDAMDVGKNQTAAIFSSFGFFSHAKLFGIFYEGKKSVLPENVPSVFSEYHKNKVKNSFKGTVIFCSTDEREFSGKIKYEDGINGAIKLISATAHCKIKIFNASLFLKKVIGEKKNKTSENVLQYLKNDLGKVLGIGGYDVYSHWKKLGIELLNFSYDSVKVKWTSAGI